MQPETREPRSAQPVEVALDVPIQADGIRRSRRYCPPTNSHRNSYEKELQNEHGGEALQFTLVGVEKEEVLDNMYKRVISIIMGVKPEVCLLQMSARKGIKKHGYKALEVILTEFINLDNK